MIVTCVYVSVIPDFIPDFIKVTTENRNESVKEPGNLRFDLLQLGDDPAKFLLYEAFESEVAAANHKTTSHYLRWRNEVAPMMAEPRKGIRYNIVEPAELSEW